MSKRKKHNPIKRLIQQSRIAVSDLCLTMTLNEADSGVQLRKYKTGKLVSIGQSVAQALDRTAFNWYVLLLVYRRERNGKTGIVSQPLPMQAAYRHDELTGYLHDKHSEMIEQQQAAGNEIVNVGWIALPVPPAISDELDEQLINLMDYSEAWQ